MPTPHTRYLVFDTSRAPFDNPHVRIAMALAIDREYLADRQIQGLRFPATGGMVPPGVAGHVPGIAQPYDPAQARERLAQAGYPGGKGFPIVAGAANNYGEMPLIAEYLTSQWKSILDLDISFITLESFVPEDDSDRDRAYMWILGWSADYLDPDNFLRYSQWLSLSKWHNDKYLELVEGARRTADQPQRLAMYRQAEHLLIKESPIIPLNYGRQHVLIKPWLPGLPASIITGNILKDIIIEPH